MKTISLKHNQNESNQISLNEIKQYYEESTTDYKFWSKQYNMHFGYCQFRRTLPFLRETMLTEMNRQVWLRLDLPKQEAKLADLGCGMGGTMRYFLKKHSQLKAIGVTISDFQVKQGNELLSHLNGHIVKENFCNTSIPNSSQDGAIAIESFCHAAHAKQALKEAYRILSPNRKFVLVDAFRKREHLSHSADFLYRRLCNKWSLRGIGEINQVKKELKHIGFTKVNVEEISWRIIPSVLHIPMSLPLFFLWKLIQGKRIGPESWRNFSGGLLSLLFGLHFKDCGYFIITAEK